MAHMSHIFYSSLIDKAMMMIMNASKPKAKKAARAMIHSTSVILNSVK